MREECARFNRLVCDRAVENETAPLALCMHLRMRWFGVEICANITRKKQFFFRTVSNHINYITWNLILPLVITGDAARNMASKNKIETKHTYTQTAKQSEM